MSQPETLTGGETTKQATRTTYVILCSTDSGSTWVQAGTQAASNKASALSHFYENRELPEPDSAADDLGPALEFDVLFQAIPSSSWKPFKPTTPRPSIPFAEVE